MHVTLLQEHTSFFYTTDSKSECRLSMLICILIQLCCLLRADRMADYRDAARNGVVRLVIMTPRVIDAKISSSVIVGCAVRRPCSRSGIHECFRLISTIVSK